MFTALELVESLHGFLSSANYSVRLPKSLDGVVSIEFLDFHLEFAFPDASRPNKLRILVDGKNIDAGLADFLKPERIDEVYAGFSESVRLHRDAYRQVITEYSVRANRLGVDYTAVLEEDANSEQVFNAIFDAVIRPAIFYGRQRTGKI